jgi:hypothetical protein
MNNWYQSMIAFLAGQQTILWAGQQTVLWTGQQTVLHKLLWDSLQNW